MITPRRTRLIRVPDLHAFRSAIRSLVQPTRSDQFILVPTKGAARELSQSLPWMPTGSLVTRDEFYDVLQTRLTDPPRLTAFERDSMMQAAVSMGEGLPFQVRPGLIAEMLRFYDQLRRQSQTVTRFQELMEGALGGNASEADRGAERLLGQTRFLAAAFRDYERRVAECNACDEHTLRTRVLAEPEDLSVRHVVVTVPDWIADPDGLYVADFDLLARIPGLQTIDIVCTEAVLGSGFHERLHGWWPGIEEMDSVDAASSSTRVKPTLLTPAEGPPDQPWFVYRDREEELIGVAHRIAIARSADLEVRPTSSADLKVRRGIDLDRVGVVFKRPLPYLYLAPDTLGAAGIPFQSADALPLAAEPTAAAIDLVLNAVETNFTRPSIVALLRTPHLQLMDGPDPAAGISALDRALSDARYLGELSRLEAVTEIPSSAIPACDAALAVGRELAPLLEPSPASTQLRLLLAFLIGRFRPLGESDPLADRERRARAAVLETLSSLADAHAAHHDPVWTVEDLAAAVRRWIGEQTFVPQFDSEGVHLLDDRAARYADLDNMTLVGLVENEWPERPKRNIFYSAALLKALGWPSERDKRAAADARFLDLLASASKHVALSTFSLDDEALVTRSMQLDEVPRARLSVDAIVGPSFSSGATLSVNGDLRATSGTADDPVFHGSLGPQPSRAWSVSALETYLDCPFKFFAQHVLRLQEEPDEEEVMDPRHQGQFVHKVFEEFFRTWQAAGHRAITAENLEKARAMFTEVVDRSLAGLPYAEAGLERTRLLGSSAAAGLGDAVLRMEAERPIAVVERLLEHRLDGDLTITTETGTRTVSLRGKADRLDLLADGTFRLIDYKLGWPPNKSRALQLPIYALCAEQQLSAARNRSWTPAEAIYLAFKGPKRVIPLFSSLADRDEVLARAQQRLADTLDAIDRGDFPPRPDDVYRCETCSFASVCRKDYVGEI